MRQMLNGSDWNYATERERERETFVYSYIFIHFYIVFVNEKNVILLNIVRYYKQKKGNRNCCEIKKCFLNCGADH